MFNIQPGQGLGYTASTIVALGLGSVGIIIFIGKSLYIFEYKL